MLEKSIARGRSLVYTLIGVLRGTTTPPPKPNQRCHATTLTNVSDEVNVQDGDLKGTSYRRVA